MIKVFSSFTQRRGEYGEQLAARYVKSRGFEIISTNQQVGRGEIDIIAKRGGVTHFFEVKTGIAGGIIDPTENITQKKKQHFMRAVLRYCQEQSISNYELSFLAVYIQKDMKNGGVKEFPFER